MLSVPSATAEIHVEEHDAGLVRQMASVIRHIPPRLQRPILNGHSSRYCGFSVFCIGSKEQKRWYALRTLGIFRRQILKLNHLADGLNVFSMGLLRIQEDPMNDVPKVIIQTDPGHAAVSPVRRNCQDNCLIRVLAVPREPSPDPTERLLAPTFHKGPRKHWCECGEFLLPQSVFLS